jgi:outer membrane protein
MQSIAAAAALFAASVGSAASAAPAAAPATPAAPTGPAIPGLCVFSQEYLIGGSVVGKFALNRLQQLGAQADAEISSEAQTLQADGKALDAQHATLTADQYDQRMAALQVRDREIQRKYQLRQKEMQATKEKAFNTIGQQAEPILRQVVAERNCSIVLSSAAVLVGSPSMDISTAVVQRLDAKIQQFAFDREHLDTQAGPSAQ